MVTHLKGKYMKYGIQYKQLQYKQQKPVRTGFFLDKINKMDKTLE